MRIGFTGTSTKTLSAYQLSELVSFFARRPKAVLVHGGCVGADNTADAVAARMGLDRVVYPAKGVAANKRVLFETLRARTGSRVTIMAPDAPLERNKTIVKMSDLLLAMPGSATEVLRSGTWATVRFARQHWHNDPARVKVVTP